MKILKKIKDVNQIDKVSHLENTSKISIKMKQTIFIFIIIIILISCKRDTKTFPGYICNNGQCTAVDKDPKYLTLQDCKSECGTSGPTQPSTGSVSISLNWTYSYSSGTTVIGLGYTSTDVANNAFFVSKTYTTPSTFGYSNLTPAVYYYKATRSFTINNGGGPIAQKIEKSGSFTISSGKTTSLSVDLY